MPKNSTTPRRLRVMIDLDVMEGPRLRKNMTAEELLVRMSPVADAAMQIAKDKMGLETSDYTIHTEWSYPWLSTSVKLPAKRCTCFQNYLDAVPEGHHLSGCPMK